MVQKIWPVWRREANKKDATHLTSEAFSQKPIPGHFEDTPKGGTCFSASAA
jgi:hypothetical protein